MEKLLTKFDMEVSKLVENYMDASLKYIDLYKGAEGVPNLIQLYDRIDKAPIRPSQRDKENVLSLILFNQSIFATKTTIAEGLFAKVKHMVEQSCVSPKTILRATKMAYNLHYDYSNAGNFEKAEIYYQYLKLLHVRYVDSNDTINDNPLGLEIATRVGTAALNYSIDYKNKNMKTSIFSFRKKNSEKLQTLLEDVNALTKRWIGANAKSSQDNLSAMKRNYAK